MLNIEKYKDEINSGIDFCDLFYDISLIKHGKYSPCDGKCKKCCDECIKWLVEECKESILDDVEREYLSAVIKPYKNKVIGIVKVNDVYETNMQYIRIIVKSNVEIENINLPWFERNTMYKGMKANKKYTLEELGL